jgi:hypothetical protein
MNQFIFLYPIQEHFNVELENGSYGWNCRPWERFWNGVLSNTNSEEEKEEIQTKALREKQLRFTQVYSRVLNRCIDLRYRQEGFEINYITFNNHPISNIVEVRKGDRIIEADLDFKIHTTEVNGEYPYPNPNFILGKLGDVSSLRVAGFHLWDCVSKIAEASYKQGCDTLVDEDLTEIFPWRMKDHNFRVSKYPTYNPFEFDTLDDTHFSKMFFETRKGKPWLWQNYQQ